MISQFLLVQFPFSSIFQQPQFFRKARILLSGSVRPNDGHEFSLIHLRIDIPKSRPRAVAVYQTEVTLQLSDMAGLENPACMDDLWMILPAINIIFWRISFVSHVWLPEAIPKNKSQLKPRLNVDYLGAPQSLEKHSFRSDLMHCYLIEPS